LGGGVAAQEVLLNQELAPSSRTACPVQHRDKSRDQASYEWAPVQIELKDHMGHADGGGRGLWGATQDAVQ